MDQLYISELLSKEELKKALHETGAGLEAIRFSISECLDHFEDTCQEFQQDLCFWGNPPLTFHGPFVDLVPVSFDSLIQEVTARRFDQCYEAAGRFHAEKVVYHSGMVPDIYMTIGWADRMIDFWRKQLPGKKGAFIVMENQLDREIEPFAEVMRGLSEEEKQKFGICLDIGHAHCFSNHEVMEWVLKLGPWIRHVHIHNNDGRHDEHRSLDEGTLPYREVIRAIRDFPGERSWTIECASYDAVMRSAQLWHDIMDKP